MNKNIILKQYDEGHPNNSGDGYWILLKKGYHLDDCHCIHEDTKAKALSRLKECKPCKCKDCK